MLTYGTSDLLTSFLTNAKEQGKTNFEVLVCETAPFFTGHTTAKILQEGGV